MPIGMTPIKTDLSEYKMLWKGLPKCGKTKTAAQFPDGIFLFTEEGASDLSLPHWMPKGWNPQEQGTYVFKNTSDYDEAILELSDMPLGKRPKTAILDTIDGAYDVKAFELMAGSQVESINEGKDLGYGKGLERVKNWLQKIVTDFEGLNMGVIFISHLLEDEIKREGKDPTTVWRDTLPKRVRPMIHGLVDFIWDFRIEGKQRWIYTQGDITIEAGSRITLPYRIPMGGNPQEAYQNILTSFYGRNGDKDKAKSEIINLVLKGETYLSDKKIDGFEVEKRKINSRELHVLFPDLAKASIEDLEKYLQHLRLKAKSGQKETANA